MSVAMTSTSAVVTLVRIPPSVRARLARSSASRPVPKLTSCSKRFTPIPTVRTSANATALMSRTFRPEANAQSPSVRRWTPARGCRPAISKAGKIRTRNTSRNVASAMRRRGPRTIGLAVLSVSLSALRIRRVAALLARRAAARATTTVGMMTAIARCQSVGSEKMRRHIRWSIAGRQSGSSQFAVYSLRRLTADPSAASRRLRNGELSTSPVAVGAKRRRPRNLVPHGPQFGKEAEVDSPAEHFDGRSLCADDVAADDAFDDLQVVEAPEHDAFVPREELLGQLVGVFLRVAGAIDVRQTQPAAFQQRVERVAQQRRELVHAAEAGGVEPGAVSERGPDDRVVHRVHVLQHVQL